MKHDKLIGPLLLVSSCLLWTSCTGARTGIPLRPGLLVPEPPRPAEVSLDVGHTVVVVALDGVRREDVFAGVDPRLARAQGLEPDEILSARDLTPNLHALMDRGAALNGSISASGPNFMSVPGYMEMMTGRRPTGCTDNGCEPTRHATLADDFAAEPGVSALEVAVIASWDGVGRAATRDASRATISVGRHAGATRDWLRYDEEAAALLDAGERAGPDPGHGDYRRDRATAAIALRYLKRVEPRFLFLGLGDTDEYAHRNDYRGYLRALGHADFVIGQVSLTLRKLERTGRRTTLLVTTDHGRAQDFSGHGGYAPESALVWLVAAGWGIEARGVVTPPSARYLADVAATVRSLAGVGSREPSSAPLSELLAPRDSRLALSP